MIFLLLLGSMMMILGRSCSSFSLSLSLNVDHKHTGPSSLEQSGQNGSLVSRTDARSSSHNVYHYVYTSYWRRHWIQSFPFSIANILGIFVVCHPRTRLVVRGFAVRNLACCSQVFFCWKTSIQHGWYTDAARNFHVFLFQETSRTLLNVDVAQNVTNHCFKHSSSSRLC